MYTLTQLQMMSAAQLSACISKTIRVNHKSDIYLDKLTSGQYLVSYAECPKTIHESFSDAEHWFNILKKQYSL